MTDQTDPIYDLWTTLRHHIHSFTNRFDGDFNTVEMMDGVSMDRNGMSIFVLIFAFMFLRVFWTCISHTPSCIDVGYCTVFWIAQLGDNYARRRDICGKDYGPKHILGLYVRTRFKTGIESRTLYSFSNFTHVYRRTPRR
jgi:hypothetical protein